MDEGEEDDDDDDERKPILYLGDATSLAWRPLATMTSLLLLSSS